MERCTSCNRAGPDIQSCGSHETCPHTTRPINPDKEVAIHCELCDATRVLKIGDLVHHKLSDMEIACQRDSDGCQAVVLSLADAPKPTKKPALPKA